jgi:hypothetical protein
MSVYKLCTVVYSISMVKRMSLERDAYRRMRAREANTTHGMCYTRQHGIWGNMKSRCLNKNDDRYESYGGRGITVCEKWKDFIGFWDDMKDGYSPIKTLDRIDNNKGYSKDNCRWATAKQQQRNMRSNVILTFNGRSMCITEWAEELGYNTSTLRKRISRSGWSVQRALTEIPKPRPYKVIK